MRRAPGNEGATPEHADFVRRLQAFETLIGREDFVRAGVVAADLLGTIERFDPRVYLPSLLSGFFSGLSRHVEAIEPNLQTGDTLAFKALEQLYKVDLDAFLALGPGGEHA